MKIGDKVKTKITEDFWLTGIYSDDFPNSNQIVITNKNTAIIVPKYECVLANNTNSIE